MGFDRSRFKETDLKQQYFCPICTDVFKDPVQRVKCEHYFCKECITEWLKTSKTCPIDRQPLTPRGLKDAPRLLTSFLSDLDIRCDFASIGCQEMVKLEILAEHVKQCSFYFEAVIKCDEDCGASFKRKDKGTHCCLSYLKGANQHLEQTLKMRETQLKKEKEEKKGMREEIKGLKAEIKLFLENEKKASKITQTLGAEREKLNGEVERLLQEQHSFRLQIKSLRSDLKGLEDQIETTSRHIERQDPAKISRKDTNASQMHENRELSTRVKEVMAAINYKDFFPCYFPKENFEALFIKWAPYLEDGSLILYTEYRGLSLVYEWVFLALMIGSRGRVIVTNPIDIRLLGKNHQELAKSGRIVFIKSTLFEKALVTGTFDIVIGQDTYSSPFWRSLKIGGVVFSRDVIFEKKTRGPSLQLPEVNL